MAAFTTVAAVAGLAATAGTTGMSFYQANKQKKLQQKAQDQANEAMAAARKKLDVNFYEQLAVKKEPYELAREASLAQGAMGIEAGREGETRGAAATAGRVQMAQNQAQGEIRTAMGQELGDIQKAVAEEDSRLRDVGVQLDLATAEGAQEAAANAAEARQQAISQGMEGVTNLVGQVAGIGQAKDVASGINVPEEAQALTKAPSEIGAAPSKLRPYSAGGKYYDYNGNEISLQDFMKLKRGAGALGSGLSSVGLPNTFAQSNGLQGLTGNN